MWWTKSNIVASWLPKVCWGFFSLSWRIGHEAGSRTKAEALWSLGLVEWFVWLPPGLPPWELDTPLAGPPPHPQLLKLHLSLASILQVQQTGGSHVVVLYEEVPEQWWPGSTLGSNRSMLLSEPGSVLLIWRKSNASASARSHCWGPCVCSSGRLP